MLVFPNSPRKPMGKIRMRSPVRNVPHASRQRPRSEIDSFCVKAALLILVETSSIRMCVRMSFIKLKRASKYAPVYFESMHTLLQLASFRVEKIRRLLSLQEPPSSNVCTLTPLFASFGFILHAHANACICKGLFISQRS